MVYLGDVKRPQCSNFRLSNYKPLSAAYRPTKLVSASVTLLVLAAMCLLPLAASSQIVKSYKGQLSADSYAKLLAVEDTMSTEVPTIIKQFRWLGVEAQTINQQLSREYLDTALTYFNTYQDDDLQYNIKRKLSKTLINNGDYDEAEQLLLEVRQYFHNTDDLMELSKVYQYLGDVKYRVGAMDESLKYMLNAHDYGVMSGVPYAHAAALNWLAIINNTMGDYKQSIEILSPFIQDYYDGKHQHVTTCTAMLNLCIAHRHEGNLQEAERHLRNSYDLFFELDSPRQWIKYYGNYYSIMTATEDYQRANMYADTMIAYAVLLQNDNYLSKAYASKYYAVSQCCSEEEDAMSYLLEAKVYAEQANDPRDMYSVYSSLADEAIEAEDFKQAIEYKMVVDSVSAIINTKNMATEVKRIEKARLKEQSQKEIALLEEQARLKEENLSKQKKLKYTFVLFSLFLLGVVYLITTLLRERNRDAQLLESKNEAISKALDTNKMLIKEVHHRVKNNLQVVSSLLNLQSRYIDNDLAREALSVGRSRVQSMSLLHQSLYMKDNVKLVDVKAYFENLADNLFHTYQVDKSKIQLLKEIDPLEIDVDVVIPMGLICNELISNALKYAYEGKDHGTLLVKLKDEPGQIVMTIADDGKGVPFTTIPKNPTSLGMKLIDSFADKLEADVIIDNKGGSSFSILITKNKIDAM